MPDKSLALLFPGQGSQMPEMGKDLFTEIRSSRDVFEAADQILKFPLTEYCFKSMEEDAHALKKLTNTAICQPALFTHSIAILAALDLAPDLVAGHSVGEYTALHASGALSFEDALRLVRFRGELMAMAGQGQCAGMTAVIGLSGDIVDSVCRQMTTPQSTVVCANFNTPTQTVISGDAAALRATEALLTEMGARKLIPLPVSGAFHSPLVSTAREALAQKLSEVTIKPPVCPIYLNVTAQPALDPEHIRARMLEQLTSPVRWVQSLQNMPESIKFIEVGSGRVLSGLARQTLGRSTDVISISSASDVRDFLADK